MTVRGDVVSSMHRVHDSDTVAHGFSVMVMQLAHDFCVTVTQ